MGSDNAWIFKICLVSALGGPLATTVDTLRRCRLFLLVQLQQNVAKCRNSNDSDKLHTCTELTQQPFYINSGNFGLGISVILRAFGAFFEPFAIRAHFWKPGVI
jgi:hypothetical protein